MRALAAILFVGIMTSAGCSCGGSATGAGGNGGSGAGNGSGAGSNNSSTGTGSCAPPKLTCGKACVDIASDPKNCGDCDNVCGANAQCCSSKCVETASCAFAVTSLSPANDYVNGGAYVKVTGAGFKPGAKAWIGDGLAVTRFVDGGTLLVLTPPGPSGKADVKVEQGGASATLPNGFSYTVGGLSKPWQQKPLSVVRGEDPGVAVLQDGRVLVAGGTLIPDSTADALDTAELYTRSTDTVTPVVSKMSTRRWQNAAVTLMDGRALVVGAACHFDLSKCNGADPLSADLFTPGTDTFTPTKAKLNVGRAYPRAVLLGDGRVLIASANDPSLEVYDPAADTFTMIPGKVLHQWGFLVRLRDGRALLGGGNGGETAAEIFDPFANTLTSVGPMKQGRSMLTAHTIHDGRVVVIGGSSVSAGAVQDPLDSIEVFDPKTSQFELTSMKLAIGRTWHASAFVRDGSILAMGGYTAPGKCDSSVATVDQIDAIGAKVTPFAVLPNTNTEWVAVTLLDGSVLGVGGGACGSSMALPDLDFLPGSDTPN
jgi:hypothetical protein